MMQLHCHDWGAFYVEGSDSILFSLLVSPEFNTKGRKVSIRIAEYSDEFRWHTIVYVYKPSCGRVLWGVSLIQNKKENSDSNERSPDNLYRLTLCAEFYMYFMLKHHKGSLSGDSLLSILSHCMKKNVTKFRPWRLYEDEDRVDFSKHWFRWGIYEYHMKHGQEWEYMQRKVSLPRAHSTTELGKHGRGFSTGEVFDTPLNLYHDTYNDNVLGVDSKGSDV